MNKVVAVVFSVLFTMFGLIVTSFLLFSFFTAGLANLNSNLTNKIDTLQQKIDNIQIPNTTNTTTNNTDTDTSTSTSTTYKDYISTNVRGDFKWTIEDKKTANDMNTMTEVLNLVLDQDQTTNYQTFSDAETHIESFLTTNNWVKGTPVQLGSNSLFATTYTNPTKNGRTLTLTIHGSAGFPTLGVSFNYIDGELN